jgi:Flp pilus assembly pilin Flp
MPLFLLTLAVQLHTAHAQLADRSAVALSNVRHSPRWSDDAGQATTEYALVLLAAALVALLVVAWATAGGGAAKISGLFNKVIDAVTNRV